MAISPTSISFWIFWAMTGFFRCLERGRNKGVRGDRGTPPQQWGQPPQGPLWLQETPGQAEGQSRGWGVAWDGSLGPLRCPGDMP